MCFGGTTLKIANPFFRLQLISVKVYSHANQITLLSKNTFFWGGEGLGGEKWRFLRCMVSKYTAPGIMNIE